LRNTATVVRVLEEFRGKYPDWGYAAAQRALGAIYLGAPRLISVGSTSKAQAALSDALMRFPQFPGNRLGWAKFLRGKGRTTEAVAIAREVRSSAEYARTDHGDFELDRVVWDADLAELLTASASGSPKRGSR